MRLLFFLGRSHDLCLAELETVLTRFGGSAPEHIDDEVYSATVPESVSPQVLMSVLGGVKKIAEVRTVLSSDADVVEAVTEALRFFAEKNKLYFTATVRGTGQKPRMIDFKNRLEDAGVRVRFAEPANLGGADAALLSHKKTLVEVIAVPHQTEWLISKTVGVQDIDSWSKRDYEKPYRDAKKGMLPPKVARMMVNLALDSSQPGGFRIADPFCGSGTILLEGAVLGSEVIGSDQSRESVQGSGENLHWLETRFGTQSKSRLSIQDATQFSQTEAGGMVDAIVTEPFLGKPTPKPEEVSNIAMGIEKLLLGSLKQWRSVLKPGARVVIVFPRWTAGKQPKDLHALVDRLGSLGYNVLKGPLLYTREQTQVQREIYVFTYKG